MPKVSIIIPAYNQADYLGEAIESALGQTYKDLEVIVVDDGSTDHTSQVVHSYSDPRLRYIYQENRGLSGARNTGIRNSNGIYLSFLDSDDRLLPNNLELLANKLDSDPELGLVAGQFISVTEAGEQIGSVHNTPLPEETSQLLLGNKISVGCMMVRRSWVAKVGYFDETLRSCEDWDMWLRMARVGCKMAWVPKPVFLYRFHPAQMTRIGRQMTEATFAVLDKIYSDHDLPEKWIQMKDQAYSKAYLFAAARAYLDEDIEYAQDCVGKAVELWPELTASEGRAVAEHFFACSDAPKVLDTLQFLEIVFNNLPESLAILKRHRRDYLGQVAIQQAFQAYWRKDYQATHFAALRAVRYSPKLLTNRGVIAILLRSYLKKGTHSLWLSHLYSSARR